MGHVLIYRKIEEQLRPILLDIEDYMRLKNGNITLMRDPYCKDYVVARVNGRSLAREVMRYKSRKRVVDHINKVPLDNRKKNLRIITHQQNCWNRRGYSLNGKNPSRYKGVSYDSGTRGPKWKGGVTDKNGVRHRKRFHSEEDAARYHDKMAKKYHGKFAHLNFPEDKE